MVNRASAARGSVSTVVATLSAAFGSPDHGNKQDPLDELVFILLSQMTTHHSYRRVFERLKSKYPSWVDALRAGEDALTATIADAGLSHQKAPRIMAILGRLENDFGQPTLFPLNAMSDSKAECYLRSLPGVGIKTARCVMMYSLGRDVLPVDTHLARVAYRMGWVRIGQSAAKLHATLDSVVQPSLRFELHVNAIPLGRMFCLAKAPRCQACPVVAYCKTGAKRMKTH